MVDIIRNLLSWRAGQAAITFTIVAGTLAMLLLHIDPPQWWIILVSSTVSFVLRGEVEELVRPKS